MAIAVDATTYHAMTSGGASESVSHTVAGSNRYMLVGIARGYNETTQTYSSGPAYNGVSMTLVATVSSPTPNSRIDVYELTAPATGAHNFTFTYSANSAGRTLVMVRSFTGVHQTVPRGTTGTFNTGGSTTSTVNVSSAVDELVVDFLSVRIPGTLTVGGGQTQRINQPDEGGAGYGASSDEAGAGTVTMSWTNTNGDESSLIAIPLKPAASATLEQEGFRWYEDNGSESAASASANQDTNITAAAGATKRLRMLVNATGDPATKQFKLQWRKTAGTWADVT